MERLATTRRRPAGAHQGGGRAVGGAIRLFAMTTPGLAQHTEQELVEHPGLTPTDSGNDGRADVVLFEADRGVASSAWQLRTTEDLFVEIGRTLRADGDKPRWIAARIWRRERVQRALSLWAAQVQRLSAEVRFRVIVRVLQERSFLRTDLRRELTKIISTDRPRWRVTDPAQLEVWITEYRPGRFVAGARLSTVAMRQHDRRDVERHGALRPVVASAMVRLAGKPDGMLLDPCCGSGTILAEAMHAGWDATGFDIDLAAVQVARRNAPAAAVEHGDARRLGMSDSSVAAIVSNLPFGDQFGIPGDQQVWLGQVLGEMARVTRPGGQVVVLSPHLPPKVTPAELCLEVRTPIRLLGMRTTISSFHRA